MSQTSSSTQSDQRKTVSLVGEYRSPPVVVDLKIKSLKIRHHRRTGWSPRVSAVQVVVVTRG